MQTIHKLKSTAVSLMMFGVTLSASAAPTINLIDVGGVTGSQAEQGFKIAAKYWESVLTNDVVLNFEVRFDNLGPGILGSTGSTLFTYVGISDYYSLLANNSTKSALDVIAGANLSPLSGTDSVTVKVPEYINVGANTGIAASGTRTAPDDAAISATMALSSANAKALLGGGYENLVDGGISFSNQFNFDFDPTNGITAGFIDFIGVAVHEIGHALGFISGADDFDYSVGYTGPVDNYWWGYGADMFRYSAPSVLDWTFGTNSYFSIDGGATVYQDGYFSTGTNFGDGWQASHWKEPNTQCQDFRGIMNPYICGGLGDSVTGLDLALFDAIGWNTNVDVLADPNYDFTTAQMYRQFANSVPEPTSLALMLAAFGIMGSVMRRQRQTGNAA